MANPNEVPRYVAVCPATGVHLREATRVERVAYESQPNQAPFNKPVRVNDLLIDVYTGPGLWFGGAGF